MLRSSEPNSAVSANTSQLQTVLRHSGTVAWYSGKLKPKRLTWGPSAAYNSTADVRRAVARSVWRHRSNAVSVGTRPASLGTAAIRSARLRTASICASDALRWRSSSRGWETT